MIIYTHGVTWVLSGRIEALEALIRQEKVWWRVLRRAIIRHAREHPLEFWASIVAALFSITIIIQTVTSIISCVYTVGAYNIALKALP
jgi:hypothetical protein